MKKKDIEETATLALNRADALEYAVVALQRRVLQLENQVVKLGIEPLPDESVTLADLLAFYKCWAK